MCHKNDLYLYMCKCNDLYMNQKMTNMLDGRYVHLPGLVQYHPSNLDLTKGLLEPSGPGSIGKDQIFKVM